MFLLSENYDIFKKYLDLIFGGFMQITLFEAASAGNHSMAKFGEPVEFHTLGELISIVEKFAYSPAIFKNNARSKENFISCDIIGLDFDGGCSIVDIIERTEQLGFTALLSTTKSHRVEKNGITSDRFRVLFPLKDTIKDSAIFEATWVRLYKLYPEADKACKNCDRYFAPSMQYKYINGVWLEPSIPTTAPATPIAPSNKTNGLPISENLTLTRDTTHFMANAHTGLPGEFNSTLNKASYAIARSGMPRHLASALLQAASPGDFDATDEKTFNSGFDAGLVKGIVNTKTAASKGDALEDVYHLINAEFDGSYICLEDEQGRRSQILQISQNNVVKRTSREKLSMEIGRLLLNRIGKFYDTAKCDKFADMWIQYSASITKLPEIVTTAGSNEYSYHKLDVVPEPGDHPIFTEFLERTTNSRALCAFIWSLFEESANLQQYVWLYGDGGNGKSSLGDFLARLLGPTYMSKNASNAYNNKHFSSSLVGKRLAVFEDSNSVKFVQSGTFKEITGGGQIEVEAKYEPSYSTRLSCKFLFLSNYEPEISTKSADLRRLILCHVGAISGPMNHNYINNLWSERASILSTCRDIYHELCDGGYIQIEEHAMARSASDSEIAQAALFSEYLQVGGEIYSMDLYQTIRGSLKSHGLKFSQMKDWLIRTKCVTVGEVDGKTLYYGISKL